jgi:hypothetical protein
MAAATITTPTVYSNFVNSIRTEATKRLYIFALNKYMRHYHFDVVEEAV